MDDIRSQGVLLSTDQVYDFSLTVYLCFPAIVFAVDYILEPDGIENIGRIAALMVIYIPILIDAVLRKRIIYDFWLLWFAVVLFFFVTYLNHPEYGPWYFREEYGVFDYVLRPENGIYIYLLLRLVNDPKRILRCIKLSSWPVFFLAALHIRKAMERGYWIDHSNRGYEIHLSYNLSLGYSLLLFTIAFLYCALENRKLYDWFGAAAGGALILIAGSRGPILDIMIFLMIYTILKIGNSNKKVFAIAVIIAAGVLLYFAYPYIMSGLSVALNRLNISSRFLDKLLNGTISDDSGRTVIWNAAINMIKEKPLGYGAMGSRHVISKYIYVAHPHNFILEVLIDFGVFFGTAILAWLCYWTIKLFSVKDNDAWRGVFLIFFSRACQLLLSLTFWSSIGLWGALAIGVCMWQDCKRKRRIQDVG